MKKILVIKLSALGDFIQALGPMSAIRKHHKNDHITLLTTKPFKGLAEKSQYFDSIMIDERPSKFDILGWLNLRKNLNTSNFARVYDLQNNDRTSIYFKLFKKPKPEWNGALKGASHANLSAERTAGHAFDGHAQTLAIAGITDVKIDTLNWMKSDVSKIKPSGNYALIVSGCAPGREEKRWGHKKYAELCQALSEKNITPLLLGTDHEQELIEKIISESKNSALSLAGKTNLEDITTLAKEAIFAIGNDTGPMHIIAATGCRSVTLFSKHSDHKRHYPKGENSTTLFKENIENITIDDVINELEKNIKAAA